MILKYNTISSNKQEILKNKTKLYIHFVKSFPRKLYTSILLLLLQLIIIINVAYILSSFRNNHLRFRRNYYPKSFRRKVFFIHCAFLGKRPPACNIVLFHNCYILAHISYENISL